jgi:hypothetical protein
MEELTKQMANCPIANDSAGSSAKKKSPKRRNKRPKTPVNTTNSSNSPTVAPTSSNSVVPRQSESVGASPSLEKQVPVKNRNQPVGNSHAGPNASKPHHSHHKNHGHQKMNKTNMVGEKISIFTVLIVFNYRNFYN